MSRSRIASGVVFILIALPSCSLLVDMNPDGVIDKSAAGAIGKSSQKGGVGSNQGGAGSSNQASAASASAAAGGIGAKGFGVGTATVEIVGGSPGGTGGSIATAGSVGGSAIGFSGVSGGGATDGATETTGIGVANGGASSGFSGTAAPGGAAAGGASGSVGTGGAVATGGVVTTGGAVATGGAATGSAGTGGTPLSCSGAEKMCNGSCVNTKIDEANCGDCGKTCEAYQFCDEGKCLPTYVSTRVHPGRARVLSVRIATDKPHGDVFIEMNADSEGVEVSDPSATIRRTLASTGVVKFTAEGSHIWVRNLKQLFGEYAASANNMVLGPRDDLYIGYLIVKPTNPSGTAPKIPRLARVQSGNNPAIVWDVEIPEGGVPQAMHWRSASGDLVTFGEPPDAIAKWTRSSVCRFADQGTTAVQTCLSPSYARGAVVGSDGSTLWMWGRYDGTLALNPWSAETWTVVPNPPLGSNVYASPDAYVIGAQDSGTSLGAWLTEGENGPELSFGVDSEGDLIMTATNAPFQSPMLTTFNGSQALISDSPYVLAKVDTESGQIVWRTPLATEPSRVFVGPSDRIIVLDESTSGTAHTISIFSDSTGDLLSRFSIGVDLTAYAVVGIGLADMYIVGQVSSATDFHPGSETDIQGATPGVFISRYSF